MKYSDVSLLVELLVSYTTGLYYWLLTELDYGRAGN